ncbi:MAG TPA: NFACT RNA binding domain-containing protein [Chryseosolibacter sp.]
MSATLGSTLKSAVVSECFSQSKDELIIRFETDHRSFFVKASLQPGLSCLSFPDSFQRARKNSVDLFPELVGQTVSGVRQFNNERSFSIRLSDDREVLFKMHGSRSNIVVLHHATPAGIFRKNLTADLELKPDDLDRQIDWSYDHFRQHIHELRSVYFTFGKVVWKYLEGQDFFLKPEAGQWETLQSVLRELDAPRYYISVIGGKPVLSLVKTGLIHKTFGNPVEAANEFYYTITQDYAVEKEKTQLLHSLRSKIAAGRHYCEKNSARLSQLRNDQHYRVWADLIMANLHSIPEHADNVLLDNFYSGNAPMEIKLKRDLSPQKNAEMFYKKAKNQHIEIEKLETSIRQKEDEIRLLKEKIGQAESMTDLKSLRNFTEVVNPGEEKRKAGAALPYREFVFRDFRIWVGKSAQQNDLLTLKYSHKDDLWLHAKDVAGSHVLIKHQPGKNFPRDVVEYAASLAAAGSKRKNEALCPVVVTPKKFVRKRKGDPPGTVVVEREDVLLVAPRREDGHS